MYKCTIILYINISYIIHICKRNIYIIYLYEIIKKLMKNNNKQKNRTKNFISNQFLFIICILTFC